MRLEATDSPNYSVYLAVFAWMAEEDQIERWSHFSRASDWREFTLEAREKFYAPQTRPGQIENRLMQIAFMVQRGEVPRAASNYRVADKIALGAVEKAAGRRGKNA